MIQLLCNATTAPSLLILPAQTQPKRVALRTSTHQAIPTVIPAPMQHYPIPHAQILLKLPALLSYLIQQLQSA